MQIPGFFKRLLIVIYDGLLMVAVAMVTSALLMAVIMLLAPDGFFIDPAVLENPKMIELSQLGRIVGGIVVILNCLITSFLFYGWFWTHGGQTLGMRAWNLYLIKPDGKFVNWKTALIRYGTAVISWAALGMGFAWILVNSRKQTWHDALSGTQIVFVPKDKQPKRQP